MKITHFLSPNNKAEKESEEVSISASNKKGDYLWLNDTPQSRYEGWFCHLPKNEDLAEENETRLFPTRSSGVYRIIEALEVEDGGKITEIENGFSNLERKRERVEESFHLSDFSHAFVYTLNKKRKVNVYFDVRESYSSEKTKDYEFKRDGDFLILEFTNKVFLAIRCEEGGNVKEIVNRHYSYDENRNSPPFHRDVYKGISLYGKKFIFGVGKTKKDAVREADKVFLRNVFKEEEIDFLCAKKSLMDLLVFDVPGVYAGIPWFFQFWPRDEAISLKSVLSLEPKKGKEIFFRLLKTGLKKGPGGAINIDAVGWTIKRAEDILPIADVSEKEKIRRELKKYMEEFLWAYTEEGIIINRPQETWMDSLDRSGARIEMQAMKMNMYKLASGLGKSNNEYNFYKKMEEEMKKRVRRTFFDGENLYDGYCPRKKILDKTARPNIFIAAYIYPELLTKKEWTKCFENALEKLWLPWGGVATLDKKNPEFRERHTGENSESYHQGDSWFYLNNLIAIVLYRNDKNKFSSYIKKIMEASKEEIMWKGAVGRHGEVSSAKELKSEGCINQAWSSAMYLEAKKEIRL